MALPRISFGLVVPAAGSKVGAALDDFVEAFSMRAKIPVMRREAASYSALAEDVREGRIDLAWLPPIVFLRLGPVVTAIGSIVRKHIASYEAALVVRPDSRIQNPSDLRNLRAGWVDRWSAAGYVLPRVKLALLGEDPSAMFREETFHGSHRSLLRALVSDGCDVIGTYANVDTSGAATGVWTEMGQDVRILTTFRPIPPDVLAVRSAVAAKFQEQLLGAFRAVVAENHELMRKIFGGEALLDGLAPGYDALKRAIDTAAERGITP